MKSCWSLKLSEVGFFCLLSIASIAQSIAPERKLVSKEPALNYLFPIEPGKTAMLTGTMGELRNTHFHGGLDINTPSIGYAVKAASDGYILRATCSTSGYGNSLQVKHTDGHVTLYAHLNEFQGEVASFVRKERYRRKQSEIDLSFEPGQFPVKRGDLIALSGNTGSSGGPHLHFELRTEKGAAINPLVAGFEEVKDELPPLVQKIAFKTLTAESRINDQFGRFEFYVAKQGPNYLLPSPILANGRIGVEVLAYDRQENSRFKFGINTIELRVNGKLQFIQKIDTIRFAENRNILVLMDYPTLERKGVRFNKLYVDDGNGLPYYAGSVSTQGIEVINEKQEVEILLTDFFGNTTPITFQLQPSPPSAEASFMESPRQPLEVEVFGNTLRVTSKACATSDQPLQVFSGGHLRSLASTYQSSTAQVHLVDLRTMTPDSIVSCNGRWISHWVGRIPSKTDYTYYSEQLEIEFPNRSLYDTLFLKVKYDTTGRRELVSIGDETVPLQSPIRVVYKPLGLLTPSRHTGIYRKEGGSYSYLGNNWKSGRYNFTTLSFGDFTMMSDSIPPQIKSISLNSSVARLKIRDDLSGISYFEASINGQWLLMNYDYKTGVLYSERLDPASTLRGDFEIKVVDNAGNEAIYKQKIL